MIRKLLNSEYSNTEGNWFPFPLLENRNYYHRRIISQCKYNEGEKCVINVWQYKTICIVIFNGGQYNLKNGLVFINSRHGKLDTLISTYSEETHEYSIESLKGIQRKEIKNWIDTVICEMNMKQIENYVPIEASS